MTTQKQDYEIAREKLREWFRVRGLRGVINGGQIEEDDDGGKAWKHRAYRVTIFNGKLHATFDWKSGLGIKEKPDPAEVLATVCRDYHDANSTDFESWASDFGYDPDSRKAEKVWRTCLELGEKLTALQLTEGEIKTLADLAGRL